MDQRERGIVLAAVATLATLAVIAPQWSVGALDAVLPTKAARVLAPLLATVAGGWAAVTAANERRLSSAMTDRPRLTAVLLGAIAVITGLTLTLLALLT